MMLDGVVQVSTKDEFVYHEMMAHVPLFAHGNAKNVLIIGGKLRRRPARSAASYPGW